MINKYMYCITCEIFLLLKPPLHWTTFNIISFGIDSDDVSQPSIEECIDLLLQMKEVATAYATVNGWLEVGLFFHCYPCNSVQALHLHIIDMNNLGPSFEACNRKNIAWSDVIAQLKQECNS